MHLLVVCCLLAAVSAAPPVQEWIQIANAVQPLDDYVPTDLSPYDVTFDQFQEKYGAIMTGATCGAGDAHSSGTPDLAFGFCEGKQYSSSLERSRRFDIFQANLRKIEEHNILYMSGGKSYYLGINRFTDLDQAEYSHFLGLNVNLKQNGSVGSTFLRPSNVMLPDFVDWREHGYVTGVKDQENCGSCWAFSATGSLEGQHFKKTGTLVSLSEQQLVDCSTAYGNEGCNGGLMDNAFRYVKKYGIESEVSYPYTAEDGDCKYIASKVVAHCSGLVDIQTESEKQLKEAVATVGPISVAIDASRASFQLYKAGIYDEPLCSSSKLDHGVLVVGYGTQTGQDYWIVKNSWGDIWGDNGYLKMSRNKDNQCGIATVASYPLV